jgi:hypothetical protein
MARSSKTVISQMPNPFWENSQTLTWNQPSVCRASNFPTTTPDVAQRPFTSEPGYQRRPESRAPWLNPHLHERIFGIFQNLDAFRPLNRLIENANLLKIKQIIVI